MDCILHIGTEKTGTTAMQSGIEGARAGLLARGVAMSEQLGRGNNHRRLVQYVQSAPDDAMRRQGLDDPAVFAAHFEGFEEALRGEMMAARGAGARAFLISSEHFHSRLKTVDEMAALHRVLAPVADRFRVLVWLRPQHELRRSLYSTALQMGYRARPERFQTDRGPDHLYYNYHALLSLWAEVFGEAAIEARLFDEAHGGFDALWEAIGGLGPCPARRSPARQNAALGLGAAEIAYAYNLAHPGPDTDSGASAARAKVMRALRAVEAPDTPLILPDAAAFQARFDDSNRALFEAFLPGARFAAPAPFAPVSFDQIAAGHGARIAAVAGAIFPDAPERFQDEISRFDRQGGAVSDLADLFDRLRGKRAAAAPPRKRFFGLF